MSERRACKAIGACRMTMRYQTTRPDDGPLRERMKEIAHERRRFGYRRLHVLLKRENFVVNHKKLFRLYREEKLAVRRRGGRKRAIGTRAPMMIPLAPNERWSLDFVSDQLTDGRRFFSPSSMIVRGSAWRWWPISRFPASAWRENWTSSSSIAASRR
jgi:putative transposase